MTVFYEWDVEIVSDGDTDALEDGEILEHRFCDSYKEALTLQREPAESGTRRLVVLVCDSDEGRAWAYVEGGKLPDQFADANGFDVRKVPQRFHKETAKETT